MIQNLWIKTQIKIWGKVKVEYKLDDKMQIIHLRLTLGLIPTP